MKKRMMLLSICCFITICLLVWRPAMESVLASDAAQSPRVITVDFVKAKPGEHDRLLRYYELNWARARAAVLKQGGISRYQLLVSTDSDPKWDIALLTEYPTRAAYDRRETMFQPVLKAQGKVLVEGHDRADMGEIVESHTLETH